MSDTAPRDDSQSHGGADLARLANAIRFLTIDAVEAANSGHPGMPLGMADVATVLFTKFMKLSPTHPNWPDRDRFILSCGHGSMLLYSILHLMGFEDMTMDDLKRFRKVGSKTAGHPEYGEAAGIEMTTGPLGQGLATAIGMAIAEEKLRAEFGEEIVDHYTYVLASDGDLMEGVSQEAITLAGHLELSKLVVLFDDNGISIDGPLSLSDSTDQMKRFEAAGWDVRGVDGHDTDAIEAAIEEARGSGRPSLIACRTKIGFGMPGMEGTSDIHSDPVGDKAIASMRKNLGWNEPAFSIPSDIYDEWRIAGLRAAHGFRQWSERLNALEPGVRAEFERRQRGALPAGFGEAMASLREDLASEKPKAATRATSEVVLRTVNDVLPETIGGSADLTPSNKTKTKSISSLSAGDFDHRYVHYGIREHGMAAAMNGIALHGGLIPYGGTFLVFSDYARPAMRLSALMHQRVVYVMTHDSIGLGEDGPTHQPVEHLASLRAMPNMLVIRPCDAVETAEAWEIALENDAGPTTLALSRQGLTAQRGDAEANRTARGGYVLIEDDAAVATIMATGSEVEIAVAAREMLLGEGIHCRVVSMRSFELFERQSAAYRAEVLGSAPVRAAVEAGVRLGWDRYIGDGPFVGMDSFGTSGPYKDVYKHFGITAEAVADKVREAVQASAH